MVVGCSHVDASILKLKRVLDSVVVAEPPDDRSKVGFGACVHIRDQNGDEDTYQIIGVEIRPAQSPVLPPSEFLLDLGRCGARLT
jgi:transcription elongation GreA/GreB family factor